MTESVRLSCTKNQIPSELIQLQQLTDQLPRGLRDAMKPLCDRMVHFVRLQGRLVRIAQEAVEQLQLDVKYLQFDLEATRRERDVLREAMGEAGEEWE
jgi:hypothetical protein